MIVFTKDQFVNDVGPLSPENKHSPDFSLNLSLLDGHTMPLHTVALGAALTPTVLHTLINHVSLMLGKEAMY